MIYTAKALMRGEEHPDLRGLQLDLKEPDFRKFGAKYKYGRLDKNGNLAHPSLDKIVKLVSDGKVRDYHKMRKWQTKPMKGFK
jgi:hypothetical protein